MSDLISTSQRLVFAADDVEGFGAYHDFYAGGSILPISGHKGHGLNILTDLLAGALSGGGCTRPGVTVLEDTMTSIAINPAPFTDRDAYVAEIKRYSDWVRASPPSRATPSRSMISSLPMKSRFMGSRTSWERRVPIVAGTDIREH